VLSVSEFIEQINGIVAGEFIVEGEISQYGISQGKWIFFTLKDAQSVLSY
jgi:exonuclease VII large subunit